MPRRAPRARARKSNVVQRMLAGHAEGENRTKTDASTKAEGKEGSSHEKTSRRLFDPRKRAVCDEGATVVNDLFDAPGDAEPDALELAFEVLT